MGVLKYDFKLREKDCLNKNIYIFFLKLSVLVVGEHHPSFRRRNFVQFYISSMLYMYKETPEAILSVNFGLFGENFVASFI